MISENSINPAGNSFRFLKICLCAAVCVLAVFQFSENTADPDLWGHVTFGEQMLRTHAITHVEIYSWTARGQPWVNHEWLAEIALGAAHKLFGGAGILLLKMLVGLLTFALALRLALEKLSGTAERLGAWVFAALAVVEISYGFAARPQIFTALFLAVELLALARINAGAVAWAAGLPLLFLVWINTHGGVLAGFGLLGMTAGATTAQSIFSRKKFPFKIPLALWLAVAFSAAALFVNPWGTELPRWLVGSVLWLRPEIAEWNPTPFGWDHAAFFLLVAVAAFALAFSRRPHALWEMAACAAFAFLGWRSVRNAPLCAVVLLALTPAHLASALARFRRNFENLENVARQNNFQKVAAIILLAATLAATAGIFCLHKKNPFTMEAPNSQYPNAAIAFIHQNQLRGNFLTFFDWGEQVIFELPGCPPSIDGRLDTCYSRELIAAHWKFFNGEPCDPKALDVDAADFALLPANLEGTRALAARAGWQPIYYDDTAVVLAREPMRFPELQKLKLPVAGIADVQGRTAFPGRNLRWN
jgi:hypothetical protein